MKKSEGNAMKKNIEWLKAEIDKQAIVMDKGYIHRGDLIYLIDQLDEPEVLSQDWIDKYQYVGTDPNSAFVYVKDLQNLLVPKQEELETKIQELIESYKQEEDAYSNPENGWISGFIEDLKNLVEEEQKYYVLTSSNKILLTKDDGVVRETYQVYSWIKERDKERYQLTEQEIKDFDPRYWAFAEPVE